MLVPNEFKNVWVEKEMHMVKAVGIILVCLSAIAAFSNTAGYQGETITAVGPHQHAGADTTGVQDEPSQKDSIKSIDVIGLVGVKDNTAGMLTVRAAKLHFASPKGTADIDAASIEDVVTGNDSQRAIHGTAGTISMFGPYGSGRFLSLFRSKIDTLTIQYRDADGGLHGAIFTMPPGESEPLKKKLLAAGARTSIPSQPSAEAASTEASGHTEKKP
jgi:hypothetical protein